MSTFVKWLLCAAGLLSGGACYRSHSGADGGPAPTIRMQRTHCFGSCPAYSLAIFEFGGVVFQPHYYFLPTEHRHGRMSTDALHRLIERFVDAGFMAMPDRITPGHNCPTASTDQATVVTTFRLHGTEKTVRHYHGCRGQLADTLTQLENLVDEAVNVQQWISSRHSRAGTGQPSRVLALWPYPTWNQRM